MRNAKVLAKPSSSRDWTKKRITLLRPKWERETTIGLLILISGLPIIGTSIWLLSNTEKVDYGFKMEVFIGNSPKIGVIAGVLSIIAGLACSFLPISSKEKYLLPVVVLLLVFTIATLGIAAKEHIGFKKLLADDVMQLWLKRRFVPNFVESQGFMKTAWGMDVDFDPSSYRVNMYYFKDSITPVIEEVIRRCKTKQGAMVGAAVTASVLQVIACIIAAKDILWRGACVQ